MKAYVLLITSLSLIKINEAFNDRFVHDIFGFKQYNFDLSSANISKYCSSKEKCIWKCCPNKESIGIFKECAASAVDISNVTVYNKDHIATNKSLQSVFKLIPNLINDTKFAGNALWWYKAYLSEDGKLFLKFPNMYNRWKQVLTNHFCVEMKGSRPVFMVEYRIDDPKNPSVYKKWALVVSTVCLIMTLGVYAVVRELRNMNGIVLMIHLGCLIVTFITHCILESFNMITLWMSEILSVSFFHYFFKLSSFCWTNVMFYRILMSSYRSKELQASSTQQLTKYGAYAFGLSLFLTILTATLEVSDMTDTPSFVTPQIQNRGNFRFQEMESLYYLYFPLLTLLAFNWIVCFVKVIEFCRTAKQFSIVAGTRQNENEEFNRPMQIVKLNAVLTAYTLVEMLTVIFLKGIHDTQATYIMCIGPIIVTIFVWNKNVLSLLSENLKSCKRQSSTHNEFVTSFSKK